MSEIVGCYCGAGVPDQCADELLGSLYFECLNCLRVVAGPKNETIIMWNAAMDAINKAGIIALSDA